jgi:uncharacterized protein with PhoU and TrkA domain
MPPSGLPGSVGELRARFPGLQVTALIRGGGRIENPRPDQPVAPGDVLEICGADTVLSAVRQASAESGASPTRKR